LRNKKPSSVIARMGNETFSPDRGLKIVVADDNRDAADSIAVLLRLSGHRVSVAYDGVQALEQIRMLQPDAAILDLRMPNIDGYQVARSARVDRNGSLTLIALSGLVDKPHRDRASADGFDHFLVKPVEPSELERVLEGISLGAA
jgi:CheY-like chemotaxis protein